MRHRVVASAVVVVLVGCGGGSGAAGTYELPSDVAETYSTAYIAVVVADPPGDDLAEGAGEHLVIRNNATIRIDMGGWWVDADGERLPLGIGRQIDVDAELRLHPGPGQTDDDAVFVGLTAEVLGNEGGEVVLRDAAGTEVARFAYGDAGGS
ncbi:MAG TPA: lamin tail domain-containing protein [Acidimicrobiales bacterium]|nr:lamin tail domain-containing protein [Acidimicrobiales bacterium]